MILGILPNAEYEEKTCRLDQGDMVILFSDGITEATALESDEEFGEERLASILQEMTCEPANEIINTIQQRLQAFTAGAPFADDLTLVVARRTAV